MTKVIQITIDDLRKVIKECLDQYAICEEKNQIKPYNEIIDYNLYNRGYINEMAFHKKEFIDEIANLKDQLIQNWCLCAYCSLYDKYNTNYDHWCVEFSAYANRIKGCNLKSGGKYKIIRATYIDKYDLNDSGTIHRIIRTKLRKEYIEDKFIYQLSEIFTQNVENLVKFLSDDNYDTEDYIARIFSTYEE